jgi:hypothetical protein
VELSGRGTRETAADGVFRFEAVRPGINTLSVFALGYTQERMVLDIGENLTLSIRLERAPLALEPIVSSLIDVAGRVRDPRNAFFLVDAEVFTDRGRVDATDAHGGFRLRGLLEGVPLTVSVFAFGYQQLDTIIVPEQDASYVFELEADLVAQALIAEQVERLAERAVPRFAALFRDLDRERLLRYAGTLHPGLRARDHRGGRPLGEPTLLAAGPNAPPLCT